MTEKSEEQASPNQEDLSRLQQMAVNRATTREDRRRADALGVVRVSDIDVESLATQANQIMPQGYVPPGIGATDEEIAEMRAEQQAERERAFQAFKRSLLDREIDAYLKGVDNTTDRDAQRAYLARSFVLLLVVLAVVSMPIIAILAHLSPQDFGSYIAPVTGIAGTVVGYWFGAGDRQQIRS